MALTIDTTLRGDDANSYITLAEASALFEPDRSFSPAWEALGEVEQTQRLIFAAQSLDYLLLTGSKDDADQALNWPRAGETEIHQNVKKAQAQMVIHLERNVDGTTGVADSVQNKTEIDIEGSIAVKYGSMQTSNTQVAGGTMDTVRSLLDPWLAGDGAAGGSGSFRVHR